MHLKFYLPYVILATYKKPFLTSEHRRRDPIMVLGPLLGENAGSNSGPGHVWVAEG